MKCFIIMQEILDNFDQRERRLLFAGLEAEGYNVEVVTNRGQKIKALQTCEALDVVFARKSWWIDTEEQYRSFVLALGFNVPIIDADYPCQIEGAKQELDSIKQQLIRLFSPGKAEVRIEIGEQSPLLPKNENDCFAHYVLHQLRRPKYEISRSSIFNAIFAMVNAYWASSIVGELAADNVSHKINPNGLTYYIWFFVTTFSQATFAAANQLDNWNDFKEVFSQEYKCYKQGIKNKDINSFQRFFFRRVTDVQTALSVIPSTYVALQNFILEPSKETLSGLLTPYRWFREIAVGLNAWTGFHSNARFMINHHYSRIDCELSLLVDPKNSPRAGIVELLENLHQTIFYMATHLESEAANALITLYVRVKKQKTDREDNYSDQKDLRDILNLIAVYVERYHPPSVGQKKINWQRNLFTGILMGVAAAATLPTFVQAQKFFSIFKKLPPTIAEALTALLYVVTAQPNVRINVRALEELCEKLSMLFKKEFINNVWKETGYLEAIETIFGTLLLSAGNGVGMGILTGIYPIFESVIASYVQGILGGVVNTGIGFVGFTKLFGKMNQTLYKSWYGLDEPDKIKEIYDNPSESPVDKRRMLTYIAYDLSEDIDNTLIPAFKALPANLLNTFVPREVLNQYRLTGEQLLRYSEVRDVTLFPGLRHRKPHVEQSGMEMTPLSHHG